MKTFWFVDFFLLCVKTVVYQLFYIFISYNSIMFEWSYNQLKLNNFKHMTQDSKFSEKW